MSHRFRLEHMEKQEKSYHFSKDAIEALYAFGYGCYQNGQYDQAVHFFRFLTVLDTEGRKQWMGLGASYQMLKDYSRALPCYAYAAILNPNDPIAPLHAAECFLSLGLKEKAVEALDAAEEAAQQDPQKNATLLARILLIKSTHNQSTN